MKSNKIDKVLILILIIGIVISISSQAKGQDKNDNWKQRRQEFESQFPVVDYDEPESADPEIWEKRKLKSTRYDNRRRVSSTAGVPGNDISGYFTEVPPPPAIPVAESEIIVVGEVLNAEAHLSNNKFGVYSEFSIRVDEVLKNKNASTDVLPNTITADRNGGAVRYSSGRKVIYIDDYQGLPHVGRKYLFFLVHPDQSPNYQILLGYELNGIVMPLDADSEFRKFKGMSETEFMSTVREKIQQSQNKNNP